MPLPSTAAVPERSSLLAVPGDTMRKAVEKIDVPPYAFVAAAP